MNKDLENILVDLEYDKVFVKTPDGYDNKYLNEFKNWRFTKAYSFENHKIIDVITFESLYAWNEQIYESLQDIRKRCIEKYGYDIIPLDADMCGIFDFYDGNIYDNIDQKYVDIIRHKYKNTRVSAKYLIHNKRGFMCLINNEIYCTRKPIKEITKKYSKKQIYSTIYIDKYLWKKYKISFKCWTYYNIKI